jgi:hypothetical protein
MQNSPKVHSGSKSEGKALVGGLRPAKGLATEMELMLEASVRMYMQNYSKDLSAVKGLSVKLHFTINVKHHTSNRRKEYNIL